MSSSGYPTSQKKKISEYSYEQSQRNKNANTMQRILKMCATFQSSFSLSWGKMGYLKIFPTFWNKFCTVHATKLKQLKFSMSKPEVTELHTWKQILIHHNLLVFAQKLFISNNYLYQTFIMQTPIRLPNYRRRQRLKLLPSETGGSHSTAKQWMVKTTLPGHPLTHKVKD